MKTLLTGASTASLLTLSVFSNTALACEESTAMVSSHVTAGRAEARDQTCFGTFCYGGTYYSIGGDDNLGTSSFATKTLYSTQTNTWHEGTCPTGPSATLDPIIEEWDEDERAYTAYLTGTVIDPNNEVIGLHYQVTSPDGVWPWNPTSYDTVNKTFITDVYSKHAHKKGDYELRVRLFTAPDTYTDVFVSNFTIDDHPPACRIIGFDTWDNANSLYAVHHHGIDINDQDGDIDQSQPNPEARLAGLGQAWEQMNPGIGYSRLLTKETAELTLGQEYTIESRVFENGTEYRCDDYVFTATDTAAPYIRVADPDKSNLAPTNKTQINLGDVFTPEDSKYIAELYDDYDSAENLTYSFTSNVDNTTVGKYVVKYFATDTAGNTSDGNYYEGDKRIPSANELNVFVVDPASNNSPTINNVQFSQDENDPLKVNISGSASDLDGDLTQVYVYFTFPDGVSTGTIRCNNPEAFSCTFEAYEDNVTYGLQVFAEDANGNESALSERVDITFSASSCEESTLAEHVTAGRAYEQYSLYYATGSAEYLGSTLIDANTVVSLDETTPGVWNKVASCH